MPREIRISEHPATIVVDVANVMGSRPDGWWRDRAGAAVRLHGDLARLAASGRAVLPPDPDPAGRRVGPGPRERAKPPEFGMALEGAAQAAAAADQAGRNGSGWCVADGSGDDAIVALVRELPRRRVVVTADRELGDRCRAAGAEALSPGWLLRLLRS